MRRDRTDAIVQTLIDAELSASETCQQLLAGRSGVGRHELRRLEGDHRQAVSVLRERRGRRGDGWPTRNGFAPRFAQSCGRGPALRALLDSEERAIQEYERALECPLLSPRYKRLIDTTLLPLARSHLPVLSRCLKEGL